MSDGPRDSSQQGRGTYYYYDQATVFYSGIVSNGARIDLSHMHNSGNVVVNPVAQYSPADSIPSTIWEPPQPERR
ncbi:hypothetical protein CC2G_012370 [Coprinopsis cinerea AmutBmut pab1-1]|nr:hypothetical protein CC2G_012370 [Coprinopsis cinerea AmutBmut pab1-1]